MDVEMLLHTFPIIRNMETWRQRVCWAKRKPQSKWYLNSKIWDQRNWHAGMGQIWWTSHLVDVSCHFCMKHPIFGSSAVFSPRTFASCPANRNAHNWWSANTLMRACLAWELSWGEPLVHVEVQRAKAKAFWCCWMLPASKCAMPLTIRRRNRSRVSSSRFQRDWLTGFMVYLVGITHHSCFFLAIQNIWGYYNWYICFLQNWEGMHEWWSTLSFWLQCGGKASLDLSWG